VDELHRAGDAAVAAALPIAGGRIVDSVGEKECA